MAVLVSLMVIAASSPLVALLLRAAWVTLSCYWLTPMRIRRAMAAQGVRGPPPRPLVGNLREVSALVARATADDMPSLSHDIVGRLMPHYVLWSGTYGKLFVYLYGSEPRLCLTDTALIKEFLSSKYAHATGKSWLQRQGTKHFIGGGLLMANGARWAHQRHVVAPAFMADKLKARGRVGRMVECTKQAIRELRDAAAGRRGEEVEIGAHMTRLTGDIISRTEFNTSYDTGKRIFLLLEHLQRLTSRSSRHLWIPGSQYFPSKYRREIRRLNGELEAVLMESIRRSREIADEGRAAVATYGRGLLAMLLSEMEEKEKNGGGGGGEFSYDAQLVIDECKTFFFAGHETSALLLTWAIMLLATNPAWQEKARTEVAAVCGDHPPSADHLSKLTVLQMIIQETLRLYPPATLLPRMAFEDIQLGGLRLPRGLSVWIPVLAIHHDESIWGPDAHEFRPERFAPGARRPSAAGAARFLPFAAGPRNCVGQAYALVEAKVVLAMLLSAFRFAISDNYRHAPENVLTLRPKHGVPVHLRPLRP
ncbi:Os09g0403300 [Oryza sativa Japonica Group]|uniref:Cytochrome P450 monooxygenase CYP72A5 n=2 Tax=Oryza TaxID=4527 RepID=Q69MH0_ORYSJ|nr:putative cytochrome P450 monooxygenase CYP72A5 [Oryza sativa Japonica Group]BAD36323.1 putative cytochrome P450 monooxygenase CYP72A5 [Oryza sativa Japonica Group]BAH94551.1 Os09g0403300 [Oryza sativa Japonica Group]|eukprot:NP_001175823.1 Os09g0403300 [Oryza sativa Japonica Group]